MKRSTALRSYIIGQGSLNAALTDLVLTIYGGTVPDSADAALADDVQALCVVSAGGDGTGLQWEQDIASGALIKSSNQVWQGTNTASGTATFFRLQTPTDDGSASTALRRMQGTVGIANADLVASSATFTQGDGFKLNNFVVTIPSG